MMKEKPVSRPSGRILVGKDGTRERVEIDTADNADNSRAHGYDTEPGRAFNARKRAGIPASAPQPAAEGDDQ
jgi:hypothetical protein